MQYILSHKTIPVLQIELDEATGAITGLGELYAPARLPVGVYCYGLRKRTELLREYVAARETPRRQKDGRER